MIFGKFLAGAMYTTLIGGAVLFHEGAITVNVKETHRSGDPERVFVVAPAAVVPWAVKFIPVQHMPRLPEEAMDALPALQAAADELERMPDAVFVEVQSPREQVKIAKDGGNFTVDVVSDREEVHISVPVRAARHTIENLIERMQDRAALRDERRARDRHDF